MSSHSHVGLAPYFTATILVCLAISACGPRDDTMSDTMEAAADTAAAATTAPSDAQIAHVAVTANSIDSGFAEMALTKAQSQSVKDFAQTMITDHGAVNKQAVDLATRLNVTPMENDISGQLQSGADQARPAIENLTGAAFDSAYIAREVQYHQAVLDALDQTLIPGAQNAELKSLLESARPAFVDHLERARQIQGTLSGT